MTEKFYIQYNETQRKPPTQETQEKPRRRNMKKTAKSTS